MVPAAARDAALAIATTSALVVSLSGCGMINSVLEQDKLDYRGAKKQPKLEVPPDLTQLEQDNRYSVPDGRGVALANDAWEVLNVHHSSPLILLPID